jgi:signal peptidase I
VIDRAGVTEKAMDANKPSKRKITGFGVLLLFVLAFAIFFRQSFMTIEVTGNSMLQTFHSGDRLLATNAYWLVGDIRRNDVVVIKDTEPGKFLVKRVNRLENEPVDFPYVPDTWRLEAGQYVVPPGTVYVLGDNLPESQDSRAFGPVERSRILGKVVLIR